MHRAGPQVTHLIASTTTKATITRGTITSVAIGAGSHVSGSIPFMREQIRVETNAATNSVVWILCFGMSAKLLRGEDTVGNRE